MRSLEVTSSSGYLSQLEKQTWREEILQRKLRDL